MVRLKYGNVPDRLFNPVQLQIGVRTEMEHTRSPKLAKQIAKAHLKENGQYYTYLAAMEKVMNSDARKRRVR